jgi:tyrosine-protein phosphatase YwqE
VFSWLKKSNPEKAPSALTVDVHSHLLPGIDDGVQSFEEAEAVVLKFVALGYQKLITTPHVMSDTFRNTPEIIRSRLSDLRSYLAQKEISIPIKAAAEYYLDEDLIGKVEQGEPLLTFGQNYVLFETNFITEPLLLKQFVFLLATKGYSPVLAHPERYIYLQNRMDKLEDLINRGVLFQVNASSLSGYYSKGAQFTAFKLIDRGWIHFLGSDCHTLQHVNLLEQVISYGYFQKALSLPILNNSL